MSSRRTQLFAPTDDARARVAELRRALTAHAQHPRGESAFGPRVRAAVVGAGKSGLSAYALLASRGAEVALLDDKAPDVLARDPRLTALVASGLPAPRTAPISEAELETAELVVLSPGVPRTRPELARALARGVVVGEIELASWFVSAPLVGITGTNGKSTTTALVGHVFEAAGLRTFTGGNLGRPLAELARSGEVVDVAVVELSSYQLESLVEARFAVACWLNLTPDHADRYPDLETYGAAKARLLECRAEGGVAVLNADDPHLRQVGGRLDGAVRWFSADLTAKALPAGASGTRLVERDLALRDASDGPERYVLAHEVLVGLHNRANMCAAVECVRAMGPAREAVERGVQSFRGLPHRIELVRVLDGVRWLNDSKATNVDSAVIALRAVEGPKILIAGGKDKGAPWAPLVEHARGQVKAVLAIGAAAPIVERAFSGAVDRVEVVETLERAVVRAQGLAAPGDAVLLSPACASFDQFDHYEHRGDTFRALVGALAPRGPGETA